MRERLVNKVVEGQILTDADLQIPDIYVKQRKFTVRKRIARVPRRNS